MPDKKPSTVDEYIATFDAPIRHQLEIVRDCLKSALPKATEKISWSMPTYWYKRNLIHFAGMKKHIGLYPGAEAVVHFTEELDRRGYKHSKGAIQIPYGDELPLDFIKEIALWCERNNK